jgi:hypothetical protein
MMRAAPILGNAATTTLMPPAINIAPETAIALSE